ncbi:MAG: hypothetical protein EXS05_13215 [Planctomycetaceae bacterium]|nr:hypothetical protein [Planctomycetaceae bacterium]
MASILSQSEVTSLLAALDPARSGRQARDRAGAAPGACLGKNSLSLSPAAIAALKGLHERFAHELSQSFSRLIRGEVAVTLIGSERSTCGDFALRLESPTCLHRLEGSGLLGSLLLDLSPSIVFPLADRLLGGGGAIPLFLPQRSLTEIELRLLARIVDVALASLQAAWSAVCPLKLHVAQVVNSSQQLTDMSHEASAMLASFEVSIGEARGILSLCLPESALGRVAAKLESTDRVSPVAAQFEPGDGVDFEEGSTLTRLVVYLASARLTADEIENLAEGDVIVTERRCDGSAVICVDGQPRFEGSAGVSQGQKAVRITAEIG